MWSLPTDKYILYLSLGPPSGGITYAEVIENYKNVSNCQQYLMQPSSVYRSLSRDLTNDHI